MNEEFEKLWEQVEENFDWNKVYSVMKLLDWWWHTNNNVSIPSPETIANSARAIAYRSFIDGLSHSAGGFYTSYDEDGLNVKFVVEYWHAEKN